MHAILKRLIETGNQGTAHLTIQSKQTHHRNAA